LIGQIDELLVPRINYLLKSILGERFLDFRWIVISVMFTKLNNLSKWDRFNVRQINFFLNPCIFNHILKQLRFFCYSFFDLELSLIRGEEHYLIIHDENYYLFNSNIKEYID
jgi:hypothetical protein